MEKKKLYKLAMIGAFSLSSLTGISMKQQEVFPDLKDKSFSALEYRTKMYKYFEKDFDEDGKIDHIRAYYDLDSNGTPDCVATFYIGLDGQPSKYAEIVCYSKTEDGIYQAVFVDTDLDGKLETKLSQEELDQANKYRLIKEIA